jgi:hypothetical protein
MALVFAELTELAERVGVCDVFEIPSEEITQNRGFDINGFHSEADEARAGEEVFWCFGCGFAARCFGG